MFHLPGLVDVHTHMREPGGEHKETYDTGTAAALAGGITTVLAMPNTSPPVACVSSLAHAFSVAAAGARCDYGLYMGVKADGVMPAAEAVAGAVAVKLYLGETFGPLIDPSDQWMDVLWRVPPDRVICLHAEGMISAPLMLLAAALGRPVHLCHVSRRDEILMVRAAKEVGLPVTCEVTPHHLFLEDKDARSLGAFGHVKPPLTTAADRQALWDNMAWVDCFATDHAPHTRAEKESANPPPGLPGLQTMVPLLLSAVAEGRLSLEDVKARLCANPRRIFSLDPPEPDTGVWVDFNAPPYPCPDGGESRAGWTPFAGRELRGGVVRRVLLRGQPAFEDGVVKAAPGTGRNVRSVTAARRHPLAEVEEAMRTVEDAMDRFRMHA